MDGVTGLVTEPIDGYKNEVGFFTIANDCIWLTLDCLFRAQLERSKAREEGVSGGSFTSLQN
jgi:hypothetical protein